MKPILIAFDIDGTLRSNIVDQTKAPVANEDIRQLLIILSRFKNVKILVWSGAGELYARQVAAALGLDHYIDEYADKMMEAIPRLGQKPLLKFNSPIRPDIAVDDMHEFSLGDKNLIVKMK